MRIALIVVSMVLAPSVAHADRFALGVSFAEADGSDDESRPDGLTGRGVWGRIRLSPRLSAEAELARATTETGFLARRAGAALVVDLTSKRRLTPFVLGAIAAERAENGIGGEDYFRSTELGAGLSFEVVEQLAVGVDVRLGERTHVGSSGGEDVILAVWIPGLVEGDYASARVTVGVTF